MINSRKYQLVVAMLLACIYARADVREPNQCKPELKFEIVNEEPRCLQKFPEKPASIKPTHVAEFLFQHPLANHEPDSSLRGNRMILETFVGKSMTKKQRDYLTESVALSWMSPRDLLPDYYHLCLYAVSQEDAKKMVEAVIEILTNKANAKVQALITERQELEQKLPQLESKYLQKGSEYDSIKSELQKKCKEGPYSPNDLIHGSGVDKEAKEYIFELNKKIDAINIRIAGIRAKLVAIQKYQVKGAHERFATNETMAKLEQLFITQTIELKGAEVEKETATNIRTREEEFYNMFSDWERVRDDFEQSHSEIQYCKHRLEEIKALLTSPTPDMLPPQVYQNKVTIYPVHVDE